MLGRIFGQNLISRLCRIRISGSCRNLISRCCRNLISGWCQILISGLCRNLISEFFPNLNLPELLYPVQFQSQMSGSQFGICSIPNIKHNVFSKWTKPYCYSFHNPFVSVCWSVSRSGCLPSGSTNQPNSSTLRVYTGGGGVNSLGKHPWVIILKFSKPTIFLYSSGIKEES